MGVNNQFFPYANKEEGVCCSVLTMRKEDKDVRDMVISFDWCDMREFSRLKWCILQWRRGFWLREKNKDNEFLIVVKLGYWILAVWGNDNGCLLDFW